MIRKRLVGLLASLAVIAIVIGMPILLLRVGGNPIPTSLPGAGEVWGWLSRPDDGTVALAAIMIASWLVWGLLTLTLVLETVALVRGVKAPTLPGLPQSFARRLVAASAMLIVSAPPLLGGLSHALADEAPATPVATAMPTDHPVQTPVDDTPVSPAALFNHVVQPGDTLAQLASDHLGDPDRWPEIYDASRDVAQPEGDRLADPDLIMVGWTLRIPTQPAGSTPATVVVQPGDNLSAIAANHLGDPDRWPEIYHASTGLLQPDGRQLTDPDVLEPGWRLNLPSTTVDTAPPAPEVADPPTEPAAPDADATPPPPTAEAEPPVEPGDVAPDPSDWHGSPTEQPIDDQTADEAAAEPTFTNPAAGVSAPWLLTGVAMGGAVLAGSALMMLRRRREQQFRLRRPGRMIPTPAANLVPVEKTITTVGSVAAPTVTFMDEALRRLAANRVQEGVPMPDLAGVEIGDDQLTLHLAAPTELEQPWATPDDTRLRWTLQGSVDLDMVGPLPEYHPAPYPLLATTGTSDSGEVWLLNYEQLGTVRATGDPEYAADFLRYLAAELAVNPWSRDVRVSCLGVAEEVQTMNPERFRAFADVDRAVTDALSAARFAAELAERADADAPTGRSAQLGDEMWPADVVLADATTVADSPGLQELIDLVEDEHQTTCTAIVVGGHTDAITGTELVFTMNGRVLVGDVGLDLVAVGLTPDEAWGCASVLAQADRSDDVPITATSTSREGWRAMSDDAGALRQELTIPRTIEVLEPASCVIEPGAPLPASTTSEDLDELAPKVTGKVREAVEKADPTLDADVTDWFADECWRPRLTLLGPVAVRAHGQPIEKRKAFYVEVLSYIALREHGATPDELATAFGHSEGTARISVGTVRSWLGTNPRTGEPHIPHADKTEPAKTGGVRAYQVVDLLVDVDVFRRLRARGEARGSEGINDLVTALALVNGRPFDRVREAGWAWLADLNVDQHMICAIVDVAHLVVTHFLKTGDLGKARAAAETALAAAPYETIPRLDLAAVTHAEGHTDEARRIVREEVCNVEDESGLPNDLSDRTAQIIAGFDWFKQRAS